MIVAEEQPFIAPETLSPFRFSLKNMANLFKVSKKAGVCVYASSLDCKKYFSLTDFFRIFNKLFVES